MRKENFLVHPILFARPLGYKESGRPVVGQLETQLITQSVSFEFALSYGLRRACAGGAMTGHLAVIRIHREFRPRWARPGGAMTCVASKP